MGSDPPLQSDCGPQSSSHGTVHVTSFSYRYGPLEPAPALEIDLRSIPNAPRELRAEGHTGLSKALRKVWFSMPEPAERMARARADVLAVLFVSAASGARHVHVGVCCEHGRHRSVAFTEELVYGTKWPEGWTAVATHRDLDKKKQKQAQENGATTNGTVTPTNGDATSNGN